MQTKRHGCDSTRSTHSDADGVGRAAAKIRQHLASKRRIRQKSQARCAVCVGCAVQTDASNEPDLEVAGDTAALKKGKLLALGDSIAFGYNPFGDFEDPNDRPALITLNIGGQRHLPRSGEVRDRRGSADGTLAFLDALNPVVSDTASMFGATIADAFGAFQEAAGSESPCDAGLLIPDPEGGCDVHPSAAGQRVLAQSVLDAE